MTSDLFAIEGKVVLITGGSRGIGAMMARGFLEAGATVLISARKADACDAMAQELAGIGPCESLPADISTADGVDSLAGRVAERHDRVHVLVNNAGATWGASIDDYPREAFEKLLATNVTGVFGLTQRMLPLLEAAATDLDPARVINVGSVEGSHAWGNTNFAYPASKAAVHMLTRHLALSLAKRRITVNCIAPGSFHTKMVAFLLDDEEQRERVAKGVPLGRLGQAGDVVGAALYLSSRAGSYVTGSILPVDGGLAAR